VTLFGAVDEGRLRWVYGFLGLLTGLGIVAAWDPEDWHHAGLVALLAATALGLDAVARRFDDSWGTRFTAGALMPVVLAAVLAGPVPAAVVGGVSALSDSLLLRARPAYGARNLVAWTAVPLLAGFAAEQWVPAHAAWSQVVVVFVLYVAVEVADTLVCLAHSHLLGDARWEAAGRDWLRAAPANLSAALIVSAAAYGYRAGGVGVLVVMTVGLVVCQWLLLRIESVERRLRAEHDRHESYLRMVGTMVVSVDARGRVRFANALARAVLGDVEGKPWNAVGVPNRVLEWTSTRLPDGTELLSGEDVTARRDAERRVEFLAYHDRLTGLPNRASFEEELPVALAMVEDCGVAAALFLLDIDSFKRVNDDHGHDAGDALLAEVAARLRAVAGPDELLVRRGGDEFLLLAPDLGVAAKDARGARRAAARVADRVVGAFAAPFPAGRGAVAVSVSIATALYPLDACSALELDQVVDAALYGLKQRTIGSAL
jgi:diguanylate cyclase (GGDEF)-like protein